MYKAANFFYRTARTLLLALALIATVFGTYQLYFSHDARGLWLVLLGAIASLLAMRREVSSLFTTHYDAAISRFNSTKIIAALCFSSLLAAALSVLMQSGDQNDALVLSLFVISLFSLALAAVFSLGQLFTWSFTPRGLAIFVLIAGTALAFRLHLLGSAPFGVWFDEAQNTIEARRIWNQPGYWPIFVSDLSQLPALSFYLSAPLVELFSHKVLGVRVLATIAGLGSIFFTWLLARELFGARVAVFAALLLSFQRWHVTFSRFGMVQIFSALCLAATLFFWIRAARSNHAGYAVLAGLCVGLGMQTYYAMVVLLPIVLVISALMLLRRELKLRSGMWLISVFLLSAAIAYAPVANYASLHWTEFTQRMRTVAAIKPSTLAQLPSVLMGEQRPSAELAELGASAYKHLLMFNLTGDPNGRHNLPGAPMLDPVSGTLFIIGFLWIVFTFWRTGSLALLLWVCATLAGGIFSLSFEAPQAGRSIGITPALAILGALPLGAVYNLNLPLVLRWGRAVLTIGALAWAIYFNWLTYFEIQLKDGAVWSEFSAPQTVVGELLRERGADADIFTSEAWIGGPTVQLLAAPRLNAQPFTAALTLPLPLEARDAFIVLDSSLKSAFDDIRRLYPKATFRGVGPLGKNGELLQEIITVVHITADERLALGSWQIRSHSRKHPDLTWYSRNPRISLQGAPSRSTLEVSGAVRLGSSDRYCFGSVDATILELQICGESLKRSSAGYCFETVAGICSLEMTLAPKGTSQIEVKLWSEKQPALNLLDSPGSILRNSAFLGGLKAIYSSKVKDPSVFRVDQAASLSRIDSKIDFYFHLVPVPVPFSATWEGKILIETRGTHEFFLRSIDRSSLTIDGKKQLEQTEANTTSSVVLPLEVGWHAIKVEYEALTGYSQIYLSWKAPGKELEIVPSRVLRPLIK